MTNGIRSACRRSGAASLAAVALLVLVPTGSAAAQEACDTPLIADAGLLGDGTAQVTSAIEALQAAGADVRVRVARRVNASTIDAYEAAQVRSCASWRGPNGLRKNNLVVFAVAIDTRGTGIFFGEEWRPVLARRYISIQTDHMNPSFKAAADSKGGPEAKAALYTKGVVAGITEVTRLIDAFLHPPETSPSAVSTPIPGDAIPSRPYVAPPRIADPEPGPAIARPLARIGFFILGALLLAGLAWVLALGVRAVRSRGVLRATSRARKGEAQRVYFSVEGRWKNAQVPAEFLAQSLASPDGDAIRTKLAALGPVLEATSILYLAARDEQPDPEGKLKTDEYAKADEAWAEALAKLQDADTALAALEADIDAANKLATELPARLQEIGRSLEPALNGFAPMKAKGYKVEPAEALVAQASAERTAAEEALAANAPFQAKELADQAAGHVAEAIAWAKALPALQAELTTRHSKLTARAEAVPAAIATAKATHASILAAYAEKCANPIRGNGTEAETRHTATLSVLDQAATALKEQEWAKVEQMLARIDAWLDEIDSLLHSIAALKVSLDRARQDAEPDVAAATSGLERAQVYVGENDDDVRDSLEVDLEAADAKLDQAEAELRTPRPDYLLVVRLAREVSEATDVVLDAARSEVEAAERRRAKLAAQVRDANAAVSKAREYIADHRSDVDRAAKTALERAEVALQAMATATDPEDQLTAGATAEREAKEAYRSAKDDFAAAERRRRPPPVIVSSPVVFGGGGTSSPLVGGGGGGGGSTPWGGGGGGGSTSW